MSDYYRLYDKVDHIWVAPHRIGAFDRTRDYTDMGIAAMEFESEEAALVFKAVYELDDCVVVAPTK